MFKSSFIAFQIAYNLWAQGLGFDTKENKEKKKNNVRKHPSY